MDYSGPKAFSEPETRVIRSLFEEKYAGGIVSSINFHSHSNSFLRPYSYDASAEGRSKLEASKPILYGLYKQFENGCFHPKNSTFGRSKNLIGYSAEGEMTDWMTGIQDCFAMVVEIGDSDKDTGAFLPDRKFHEKIISENFSAILKFFEMHIPTLSFE